MFCLRWITPLLRSVRRNRARRSRKAPYANKSAASESQHHANVECKIGERGRRLDAAKSHSGSNRDTEGRASGSTGRPTRPQDRPRPPVPTCAWSQQLVWFESSAHLPNTEEKGKFNEFMIHGSAYTAGVDGNMTLRDLRRVAFRLAQRSVRNFWLMLPS